MKQRRVLWISTSTSTKGGVSSFVRVVEETPLWSQWDIRHVATHRDGPVIAKLAFFIRGICVLIWELILRRTCLVHLHMASYGSFYRKSILCWVASFWATPVVIHVHGAEFHEFFERAPSFLRHYIRATLHRATLLIALGEVWSRRLQAIAPQAEIAVFPNVVRPRARVAQPGPSEPVRVLFLGRVCDRKGTFALLHAWKRLADSADNHLAAQLLIAGDGELARARSLVAEYGLTGVAQILGWVSPREAEDLLRSSQVLVLPSHNEGQPMAILEAMANGLCVVATDVGGIPDLINSRCGILVPVDDNDSLVSALRFVIEDDHARATLGARALNRVKERFDVTSAWQRLDAMYKEMAR